MKKLCLLSLVLLMAGCASPIAQVYNANRAKNYEQLIQIVEKSPKPWLVDDAAYFLGNDKVKAALPALTKRLADQNMHPRTRAEIAVAIAKIGDNSVTPVLITALENATEDDERCRLINALSLHCSENVVAALQQQAQSSQIMVSRSALYALSICTDNKGNN